MSYGYDDMYGGAFGDRFKKFGTWVKGVAQRPGVRAIAGGIRTAFPQVAPAFDIAKQLTGGRARFSRARMAPRFGRARIAPMFGRALVGGRSKGLRAPSAYQQFMRAYSAQNPGVPLAVLSHQVKMAGGWQQVASGGMTGGRMPRRRMPRSMAY